MANYSILGIHPEEAPPPVGGPKIIPLKPDKGEPYARVKEKARYVMQDLDEDGYKSGFHLARSVLVRLIETAPQQTLDALCAVLDPDAP